MPLWLNVDNNIGNSRPKWANTANCFGVDRTEAAVLSAKSIEPGWVELTRGQGYLGSLSITSGGANINAAVVTTTSGYVTLTGAPGALSNTVANVSFGRNNISNTVNSVTINTVGVGYLVAPILSISGVTAADQPVIAVRMAGRAGRNNYETLVFSKSISSDASDDGTFPDT